MADFKNYDPKRYVLVFKGHEVRGVADGTHITVERDDDSFKKKVGAHGDTIRTRSHNRNGKITVQLLPTSISNDFFSTCIAQGEAGQTVSGDVGDVLLKDLNGTTVAQSDAGWILRPTTTEVGDEPPNREWVIDCHELLMFVGGSLS